MLNDIDPMLADLVEPLPDASPPRSEWVRLDEPPFDEFGIEEPSTFQKRSAADGEVVVMNLPHGRVARVSKRRLQACATSTQLKELDRSLYRDAGLDPEDFGL